MKKSAILKWNNYFLLFYLFKIKEGFTMKRRDKKRNDRIFRALLSVFAVAIIILAGVLANYKPEKYLVIAILCAVLYIAIAICISTIFAMPSHGKKYSKNQGPMLTGVMYDRINSMNEPALICDALGRVTWANSFMHETFDGALIGSPIGDVIEYQIRKSDSAKRVKDVIVEYCDKKYEVEQTDIHDREKSYHLLILRDKTELVDLKQKMQNEEKVVAYVIVDNLEELLQFEQERYREAAAKIETLIREWAGSVGGILKEYERDKYLFIFETQYLFKFMNEDKFDILDKVREIRVGSGNIPVTVSIGVAKLEGSMAEKEKAAHVALDMALQRGGDQAVVKIDNGIEFFGGRTNAVQKRTKVRSRVFANELASRMAKAGNVIVMAHSFPDYDAFGASIGAARLAMFCGVKVNIVTNFKDPNVKKCMKSFAKDEAYKGVFVDSAKGLDLVRSDTLLVIVDVNNKMMFESKEIYENVSDVVIIDHHRKTAEFEKEPVISYIETSSSSASELIAEILEQALPVGTLQANEANMLYAGILLDTKQFTKGTGTKTYAAAMYLRDNGAQYEEVQDLFKTNIYEYKQEAVFGEKIEIYRNCMAIALNDKGRDSSDRILAARVADNLLMIEDVSASFALVQIGSTVHVSARSNGTINVQLILEALNGGGRYDAAGAQVKDTIQSTLLKLKQAIDDYINPEA